MKERRGRPVFGREALVSLVLVAILLAAQLAVLWRALGREGEATARALTADLEQAARELEARLTAELANPARVPSFAEPLVVHGDGRVEIGGRPLMTKQEDPERCDALWHSLARSPRQALIEEVLARCPLTQGPSGRLLVPTLAQAGELTREQWQRWQKEHERWEHHQPVRDVREALHRIPLVASAGEVRLDTSELSVRGRWRGSTLEGWLTTPRLCVERLTPWQVGDLKLALATEPASTHSARVRLAGMSLAVNLLDPSIAAARTAKSRALVMGLSLVSLGFLLGVLGWLLRRFARLQRESELRVDFVAAVSHELRTPLASMRLLVDLLEPDHPDDERVLALKDATARLEDCAERWLTLARLGKRELSARRTPGDLAATVRKTLARVSEARGLEDARLEAPEHLPFAFDPMLIELAVENLLENAHKYGRGPILLSLESGERGAELSCTDHGPGLGPNPERLLLPFERGDTRLHQATEGVGLGLSLVASVARAHGGKVELGSCTAGGARVTLYLPLGGDGESANTE